MQKAWPLLVTLIVATPCWALAGSPAVRLDFPPGYFAAKPAPPPQQAKPSSQHDCSSHCVNFDEGYAWAGAQKLTAEEQCRGPSRAFVEGCMTYVTERRRQTR